MSAIPMAMLRMTPLFLILVLATSTATAQSLYTSSDFRQDRERWTDPAYYNNYTAREVRNIHRTGYEDGGSGMDKYDITSPYPYRTSQEHYRAWLQAAGGGTRHTLASLPDWDGYVRSGAGWFNGADIQVSTIVSALTPEYQEYFVQQTKAEAEGRAWWPSGFCFPDGFLRGVLLLEQVLVRPNQVVTISNVDTETQVRRIYTDGRGHVPEDAEYPQWQGESIGFWDGDALIVHTNQIRQWNASRSMMFEWSDQLTAVERYERMGDTLVGDITLYDPVAFTAPLHAELTFQFRDDPDFRPVYSTCTDTGGPAGNVYVDEDGFIAQKVPGDPGYWDNADPRPWAAHWAIGEK